MSSVFNASPNFIHSFELVKLSCNQEKNKSGLHGQIYSWANVIHLSRIRTTMCLYEMKQIFLCQMLQYYKESMKANKISYTEILVQLIDLTLIFFSIIYVIKKSIPSPLVALPAFQT